MLDYQKLYRIIFNGITDAIECLETGAGYLQAKETLVKAQQAAEEYFISEEDDGAADESAANLRALPDDPCQDP